jgi:hypothetical protein
LSKEKEDKALLSNEENPPSKEINLKEEGIMTGESIKIQKTNHYCAINEKDLNKVEIAFFRRPNTSLILSDK